MGVITTAVRRWRRAAGDVGMSTAEYAVGVIAATAFAGLLLKIVTSSEIQGLLVALIKRALRQAG
ncbi:DUF4244 domain-containing protein [Spirillospora sp. NPDC029432]|uniref:DUF4244 domain-containing protein n=1 Tax=Spirillospora sp. NPDC029432 TaxID=3154599 RepID=UPI00345255EC